jgi:cytochrome c oxidase cbb3-type subunit III
MVAVWVQVSGVEGRLLRADPGAIPANASLVSFAHSRGEALFDAHCSVCHRTSGQGDPARGVPDLRDGDWLYGSGSVSDIEQVIKYGIRSYHPKAWNLAIMPAYGRAQPSARDNKIQSLSPAGIRDLVESLIDQQGRSADRAAAVRGAILFAGAGGCFDCHAVDGKGDSGLGAPNLTDGITLYGDGSRESLSMSIAYGRHGICPAWSERIRPAGIRELAVYVYSLSHSRSAAAAEAPGGG